MMNIEKQRQLKNFINMLNNEDINELERLLTWRKWKGKLSAPRYIDDSERETPTESSPSN